MLSTNHDLGSSLFKTWTDEQRREEIGKLVEGYRGGVPVGILCKMAETIAGSQELARDYLASFMTLAERQAAVAKESPSIQLLIRDFLL